MTALTKYQRLECVGLWRLTASAQLREVVVGLRDTTLVLADPRSEMALSHWSLPSVERVNPGEMPALFTPGRLDDGSPSETVEIDDPDMIAALETVRTTLIRRRPKPGRLRGVSLILGLSVSAALAIFWLPEAMIRHTASVLPMASRVQIAKLAVEEAARLTSAQLLRDPFFRPFDEGWLHQPRAPRPSPLLDSPHIRYDLLARAIPAMTFAAGAAPIAAAGVSNYDLELQGRRSDGPWPAEGHGGTRTAGRWLHSDYKNVALPYVSPLFLRMIQDASLR